MSSSPPPWSRPDGTYRVVKVCLSNHDFEDIGAYYTEKRGMNVSVPQIISDLNLPIFQKLAARLYEEIRKTVSDNDIQGQVGEILTSYILEKKHNVLTFGLSWPIDPFLVRKGTDVAGVCTHSWIVIYAQSKSTTGKYLTSQANKLKGDLNGISLTRKFHTKLPLNQSRLAAIAALRLAIHNGLMAPPKITSTDIDTFIDNDKFARIGFMIHQPNAVTYNYTSLLDELRAEPNAGSMLTIIVDMTVTEIQSITSIITACEGNSK